MAYQNPWVGYISRSYEQIKQDLLDRLIVKMPEITDRSESNILIIILGMFAGIGEMINLYIDNMAQEAFIQTARRITSMMRLVRLLDYKVKAANPASVDVTVMALDNSGNPVITNASYTIPAFTQFSDKSGKTFLNPNALTIPSGSFGGTVPVKQISLVSNLVLGYSDGLTPFQKFALGTNYVQGSASLLINGVPWTERISLGWAKYNDTIFVTEVQEDGICYAIFGDNITGAIPPVGQVVASFQETLGSAGNIGPIALTSAIPSITLPTAITSKTSILNPLAASGGTDYENIEKIRTSAPLSLRTLYRAVTEQDYEDIARLAPGVGKAKVDYECGKIIPIYLVPEGGGIASDILLNSTNDYFKDKKMVGTFPECRVAGETGLRMVLNVTAKFRADVLLCQADVVNALIDYGAYANQNINRKIRISDIVAKIDNLTRVDYLTLEGLSTIPYAHPQNHTTQLNWIRETLPDAIEENEWLLQYDFASLSFICLRDSIFLGNIPMGISFTDPDGTFTFTPQIGPYVDGMRWKFKTYPFNKDIDLDDFTIPKVFSTDLNIIVNPQFNPPI